MEHKPKESKIKSNLAQVLFCLIANIATLSGGMTLGFSAVALPYMTKDDSELHLSESQASFVASCVSLTTPIGGLLAGVSMEKFGRKPTLTLSCLPAALGWFIMITFSSYEAIIVGRLLTGFATGFCCNSATVFIAEGSTPSLRGVLVNGTNLGFSIGILMVYTLGLILKEQWKLISGICGLVSVLSIVCLILWMPESPVWLVSKGKPYHALKSLAKLRASHHQSPNVEAELQEITKNINTEDTKPSTKELLKEFSRPEAYKPLIIMNLFFLFQQITGGFVVIFYGVNIVIKAGIQADPFIITVLIGLTNTIFVVIGSWASKSFGRRPCAITSGSGMTLSLFFLTFYLHMTSKEVSIISSNNQTMFNSSINGNVTYDVLSSGPTSYSWMPVTALLLFVLTSTIGFLSLPWAMLGEVFPTKIRGVACGITTCIAYAYNFIVILLYSNMVKYLGTIGLFAFYGTTSLIATIFVFFFLPETQNKSLAEIEQYFAGKKISRDQNSEENKILNNIT